MSQFNEEQQQAIDAREGQYALIAGPGSGKTTTLIGRYDALIEEGVPKTDIICVTFTKEAAESMMRRARGTKENFCTFHSLGYRICRQEMGAQPVEPELRHRLVCKLIKKWGLDYKDFTGFMSKCRRTGVSPEQAVEGGGSQIYGLSRAYQDYETERLAAGWIDFDSMLVDAATLLESPDIRNRWQFRYPLADEMQDSDNIQWRIMQMLSERHGNVMVVGDPNQSIYAWRDAHPENLTNFQQWFPNGQYIYLGRNYRSTSTIVNYVRRKAPVNTPLNEKMAAARDEKGAEIEYRMFASELDEAESAVACALADPRNSAIIARTNRGLAPAQNFCIEHNIPHQMLGKSGFWQQTEVIRTVEEVKKSIGVPLAAAVTLTWNKMEAKYRVDDATKEDNDALENLKVLRDISRRFTSVSDFTAYANRCMHIRKAIRGITIGTIHSSKGLEFKNVFVIGTRTDMMPHAKSLDFQEERRIFFVAVSRAADKLRLSWSGTPSPFIRPDLTSEMLSQLETGQRNVERIKTQR